MAQWTPLWWRLGCTSVLQVISSVSKDLSSILTTVSQHLGGIHSGCALSGIGWLLLKVVNNFRHHEVNPELILIVGTITNVAVIVGALSALPWIRNNHHK
jgi:hypothetical protein